MPSTYTTNLGIEKIATGEQSGTWGTTTNTNLDLIDEAVNGVEQVTLSVAGSSGSPNDLPITNGASSDGRNKFIEFVDGGDLGGTAFVQLTPNDAEKVVHIRNSLSADRTITIFQGTYNASNDFVIPNGADVVLKFDGAGAGAVVSDVYVNLTPTKLTTATADVTTGNITTVNATTVDSTNLEVTNLKAKDGTSAGSIADSTGVVTLASSVLTTTDINGGTIDGATINNSAIGGSTPAAGSFTTFTSNGIDDNADATAITIDSSERVLIGGTSSVGISGYGNYLQLQGTTGSDAGISVQRYNDGTGAPVFNFGKTRSTTVGTVGTVVQDGDALGYIIWSGDDGTDVNSNAAYIVSEVDGTPGSDDMPGRLVFLTSADGSGSPTERMRIRQNGYVGIGTGGNDPDTNLHVQSLYDTTLRLASTRNSNAWTPGQSIGRIEMYSADGTAPGASVRASIDAVVESTNGAVIDLVFRSGSNSEAMRINSNGNLLVGSQTAVTSVGTYGLQLYTGSGFQGRINAGKTASGTVSALANYHNGSYVGGVTYSNTATAFPTSSDYRLKEDWRPMENSIDRVKELNPVNFAWKLDGTRVDGFLAHEAQEVVPEAVIGEKDAVDAEGNPEYQGIDQAKLVPLLTSALQEAIVKIESLEARVAQLEAN